MASKGMSMTLTIIVAAVVILVTALVLLTIFGQGMMPFASLAEAKNHCTTIGDASCKVTGQLPPTWRTQNIRFQNNPTSCKSLCSNEVCQLDSQTNTYWYAC